MNQKTEWFAEETLTRSIIGAFYYVFNVLGYGFLEKVYCAALARVLIRKGHKVDTEVLVPIYFEEEIIEYTRLDMIVDDRVVVEIKSTEILHRGAPRQLVNYLKASTLEVGLLLHFGHEPKFYRLAHKHSPERLINRSNQ